MQIEEKEANKVPPSASEGDVPKRNNFYAFRDKGKIRMIMAVCYSFLSFVVIGYFYMGDYVE